MAAPRNENLKQGIQAAALRLLQQCAFADISLSAIAAEAGISKGTLYYYYSSKDDILLDITELYLDGLAQDLLSWVDNPEKDTRPARLYNYVLRRGAAPEFGALRLYLIGSAVSQKEPVRQRLVAHYEYFQQTLARRIHDRLPGADGGYLAWLLLTVMDGVLVQSQLATPAFQQEAFLAQTVALLTQAVETYQAGPGSSPKKAGE